jgi:hypothetical protein
MKKLLPIFTLLLLSLILSCNPVTDEEAEVEVNNLLRPRIMQIGWLAIGNLLKVKYQPSKLGGRKMTQP